MTWHLAVLDWLAHAALGGSLFLAVGCVAVRLCRQPVRRLRFVELALLGSLLVPWLSGLSWLPHWSTGLLPLEPAAPAVMAPTEPLPIESSGPFPPLAATDLLASGAPAVASPAPVAESDPLPPHAEAVAESSWPLPALLLVVYASAVCGLLAHTLLGLLRLAWVCRSARPAPERARRLFADIAGPAGERVRLLASDRVELPLMFAYLRPVIVMPAGLCQDDDAAALRYCLAHEWSHVERGDAWRWYLSTLSLFVFFLQPLCFGLRRQLRLCQDYLADARAAEQAVQTEDYADYLVGLARRRLGAPVAALGIGDRRSNLYRRIFMLVTNRQPLERRCRIAWSAAAGLVALGLLVGLAAVRLDAGPPAKDDKPAPAKDAPKDSPKKEPEKGETLKYAGKVFDKDTGKGIPGVTVTVRRSLYGDPEVKEHNQIMEESKHTTDAAGKYNFVIPPEQSNKRYLYIELDVEHPDYAPRKHFGYALSMIRKNEKVGGRPFFEEVDMRPGKPITGTVVAPDGKPVAGVKVLAYSVTDKKKEFEFEYGSFADCRTDDKGKFRIVLTTPGQAVYWILPADYAPTIHAVKANKRGDMGTFTLRDGIRVKGKVLDVKGKPIAGVNVNLQKRGQSEELQGLPVADSINRSAVSDARGEFTLNPLPPGEYEIVPDEFPREASSDKFVRRPVPDVFIRQKVVLKEGVEPEAMEVRAVPSVVIEGQFYDSKGKTTRGHAPHLFGQIDKGFWFGEAKADADGKVTMRVPHGLEQARLSLSTNEHGSLRWRLNRGLPLQNSRDIDLGTVNDDVKGIEIIRYVAPILIVKVKAKDGAKLKDVAVTAVYAPGKVKREGMFFSAKGRTSDVSFEKQEDGRFRSSQMLPDEDATVIAYAEGYVSQPVQLKLPEGESKEIEVEVAKEVKEKAPEKKGKE